MGSPSPPVNTASTPAVEVDVQVDAFEPYRPMLLTATVIVRDKVTGQELLLIQRTWHGQDDFEAVADANCSLQRSLKRPGSRVELEEAALATLSPRRFLRNVALQLAPEVSAACLSSGGIPMNCESTFIE